MLSSSSLARFLLAAALPRLAALMLGLKGELILQAQMLCQNQTWSEVG